MRVAYHIGLHCTDEDRIVACLLKNAAALGAQGIVVADPEVFRPVQRDISATLRGDPAPAEMQARLLRAVAGGQRPDRLVLSNHSFLGVADRAFEDGRLYPLAGDRARWVRNLFPDDPAEVFFAIRNPAGFIPALLRRQGQAAADMLAHLRPEALSWADMVSRLRAQIPDCPVTLWCDEDAPLIWPEILSALCGLPPGAGFDGIEVFPRSLLSRDGRQRFVNYLRTHPIKDADQFRRVVSVFLARYPKPDAVEEMIDLPGWSADLIRRLTERYEDDVAQLSGMEGVRLLRPAATSRPHRAPAPAPEELAAEPPRRAAAG